MLVPDAFLAVAAFAVPPAFVADPADLVADEDFAVLAGLVVDFAADPDFEVLDLAPAEAVFAPVAADFLALAEDVVLLAVPAFLVPAAFVVADFAPAVFVAGLEAVLAEEALLPEAPEVAAFFVVVADLAPGLEAVLFVAGATLPTSFSAFLVTVSTAFLAALRASSPAASAIASETCVLFFVAILD